MHHLLGASSKIAVILSPWKTDTACWSGADIQKPPQKRRVSLVGGTGLEPVFERRDNQRYVSLHDDVVTCQTTVGLP